MQLQTERLIIRSWSLEDANDLYKYAKDNIIGDSAGWKPHTSLEYSQKVIKEELSDKENYAICLKKDNKAIGYIALSIGKISDLVLPETEGEIGFWIGVPFWGQGLMPEAVKEIMRHGFEDLNLEKIWCGYFDGNEKSKRVQEKCGFIYNHTKKDIYWK